MRTTWGASATSPRWRWREDLVSIHFVNVLSRPVVAPWGGGDGRFGTNPCCIGVPLQGREPFVLDFATSRVAQGKMRVAHNEGAAVEPGYLIDEQGRPTDDPGVVVVPQSNGFFGALMTFGEHKGYGMAVACELLGGALTGRRHLAPAGRHRARRGQRHAHHPDRSGEAGHAGELRAGGAGLRRLAQAKPARAGRRWRAIAGEPEREARAQA